MSVHTPHRGQDATPRRVSLMYVEIPLSPLARHLALAMGTPNRSLVPSNNVGKNDVSSGTVMRKSIAKLKENAYPGTPNGMKTSSGSYTADSTSSPALKRKLAVREPASNSMEVVILSKKPKLDHGNEISHEDIATAKGLDKVKTIKTASEGSKRDEDAFPNGSFRCHQCNTKRDVAGIQCIQSSTLSSSNEKKDNKKADKDRKCRNKYCLSCLRKKYADEIGRLERQGEDEGLRYKFQTACPRCRGLCGCARCRKAKAVDLDQPKETPIAGTSTEPPKAKEPRPKPKPKYIPLPRVQWARLPTRLTFLDAATRIQIREFVLRFGGIMGVARNHIEELEEIAGRRLSGEEDSEDTLVGWVSDGCVKAVVLAILGLIVGEMKGDPAKVVKASIKELRAAGATLTKFWGILALLRHTLSTPSPSDDRLSFPDPLPAPASTIIRTTRTRSGGSSAAASITQIHVVHSAQMIPVLAALVDVALGTDAVKEEIEGGLKKGRERTREVRELVKKENELWDKERKEMEAKEGASDKDKDKELTKLKREAHKQNLADIDSALKVAMSGYAPRFSPLGRDAQGRTYWGLSPEDFERECASDFIASCIAGNADNGSRKKSRRKGGARPRGEKGAMGEWSWFVAVWGKRAPDDPGDIEVREVMKALDKDTEDGNDEEEEIEEGWWAFTAPQEIKNLALWIAIKSGLESAGEEDTVERNTNTPESDQEGDLAVPKDEVKGLVKALRGHAAVLEWRLKREGLGEEQSSSEFADSTKMKKVPAKNFYGRG